MKLVYKETGKEVKVGDVVEVRGGEKVKVTYFRKPHKPSSEGKVSVEFVGESWQQEFYVSVIGAEWIEREDRDEYCTEHQRKIEQGYNCPECEEQLGQQQG